MVTYLSFMRNKEENESGLTVLFDSRDQRKQMTEEMLLNIAGKEE